MISLTLVIKKKKKKETNYKGSSISNLVQCVLVDKARILKTCKNNSLHVQSKLLKVSSILHFFGFNLKIIVISCVNMQPNTAKSKCLILSQPFPKPKAQKPKFQIFCISG